MSSVNPPFNIVHIPHLDSASDSLQRCISILRYLTLVNDCLEQETHVSSFLALSLYHSFTLNKDHQVFASEALSQSTDSILSFSISLFLRRSTTYLVLAAVLGAYSIFGIAATTNTLSSSAFRVNLSDIMLISQDDLLMGEMKFKKTMVEWTWWIIPVFSWTGDQLQGMCWIGLGKDDEVQK